MTQHVPEEQLALYVSGDLNTAEIREHLEVCSDCRGVAAELEQVCSVLGGATDEPAQEQLAEVRRSVRARLGKRHAHVWQWGAAAAAAAALVICFFAGYRTAPLQQIAMTPPAAPALSIAATKPDKDAYASGSVSADRKLRKRVAVRPGIKSLALVAQSQGPPWIKITTTDPHVLILLASDERTKTE